MRIFSFRNKLMVASVMLATIAVSCTNDVNKVLELHSDSDVPSLRIVNLDGYITENGIVTTTIKTPLMLQYDNVEDKRIEFPEGIELKQNHDSMELKGSIVANRAKNHEATKTWEAEGNVIVQNAKGERLETELLFWNQEKREIYTDAPVKVINKDAVINGIGLISDETFANYEILRISNSVIYVDDKKSGK